MSMQVDKKKIDYVNKVEKCKEKKEYKEVLLNLLSLGFLNFDANLKLVKKHKGDINLILSDKIPEK